MSNSSYSSQEIIRLLFTTVALAARPTSWFVGLHTGDPGIDGSANELTTATDPNYARTAVTWEESVVSDLTRVANDAEVAFPASGAVGSYTIQFITIWDAATAGSCLARLPLVPERAVAPAGILRFPIGEIIIEGGINDD